MKSLFKEPMQKASSSVVCQVYETKNYDHFKLMPNNRNVNTLHVHRLKESFEKSHLISPIIVNEHLQVIDGQHRLFASKELGLPVHYIIVDGYGIDEVQVFNANQKNWTKKDFLEMYCSEGKVEYLRFKEFMVSFPEFGMQVSERILTGLYATGSKQAKFNGKSVIARSFENGKLEIPDLNLSYRVARKVLDFKNFYDGFNRGTFVSSVVPIFNHKKYNHKEMLDKLSVCPIKLTHCQNIEQYRLLIESIWNWKRSNKNKVSFRYLKNENG